MQAIQAHEGSQTHLDPFRPTQTYAGPLLMRTHALQALEDSLRISERPSHRV